eukprot:1557986-Rhodomonas_salina.3
MAYMLPPSLGRRGWTTSRIFPNHDRKPAVTFRVRLSYAHDSETSSRDEKLQRLLRNCNGKAVPERKRRKGEGKETARRPSVRSELERFLDLPVPDPSGHRNLSRIGVASSVLVVDLVV